jgi:hypothetical protein
MSSTIMDPTGRQKSDRTSDFALAERRADLSGVTVGLLENGKQNARLFLEEVGAALRDRYGVAATTLRLKQNFTAPAPPELVEEMRSECDVMVIGVGDCGSCSASAVADGVTFERKGTPAAVICSEAFEATANAMAEVQGAPGYHYLTTPHPVAGLTPQQVHERAEAIAAEVAALLGAEARQVA